MELIDDYILEVTRRILEKQREEVGCLPNISINQTKLIKFLCLQIIPLLLCFS